LVKLYDPGRIAAGPGHGNRRATIVAHLKIRCTGSRRPNGFEGPALGDGEIAYLGVLGNGG